MILVLDHAEDEERGVRGVIRVGGGHQIETGEGVDRVHQVIAGERRLAVEIGDGGGGNRVLGERGEGQAQSGRQNQGNKLLHGVSSFQSGVDG